MQGDKENGCINANIGKEFIDKQSHAGSYGSRAYGTENGRVFYREVQRGQAEVDTRIKYENMFSMISYTF